MRILSIESIGTLDVFLRDLSEMKRKQSLAIIILLFVLTVCLCGCGDKLLDPTQIGRFRPVPAVNVILDSLGVAEETPSPWETAEDPKPIDIIPIEADYVLGPGDVIRIDIFELLVEGGRFVSDYRITETGKISIPIVGTVQAAGFTESQLEDEIARILSPGILIEPSVSVIMMQTQHRVFTIRGQAVPRPGRYPIARHDYRLNDALAESQVATQFNVSYVYVSRALTGKEQMSEPAVESVAPAERRIIEGPEPEKLIIPEEEMMEIIAPRAQCQPDNRLIITSAEMVTDEELADLALPEGFDSPERQDENARPSERETIDKPIIAENTGRVEWVFQDGRWVPIQIGGPGPAERKLKPEVKSPEPLAQKLPEEFDWEQVESGGLQTRVIRIPTDKLSGGDPRYNIVIRPGDSIHIPVDVIGEYFVMGNTNSTGAVRMDGRPLTLRMAIAAAGGLGPLAWPKRVEVTRRIGKKKEMTVMVDLDKIASGEQPDFFIKPLDTINVGTHPTARWRAVLRNAFRATYGFGFIYDRNFADRDFGTRRPIPHWF